MEYKQDGSAGTSSAETSKLHWFIRGVVVGCLLIASSNALSFFVRSRGWGSLLGNREPYDEAIGFPLLIWQEAADYSSHTMNTAGFVGNISVQR